jgi:hypothetical protein
VETCRRRRQWRVPAIARARPRLCRHRTPSAFLVGLRRCPGRVAFQAFTSRPAAKGSEEPPA